MSGESRKHWNRDGRPPMPEPLAYFLTWKTYGTWLPGDQRGWVAYRRGMQIPDPVREKTAAARLTESPCYLAELERALVEKTIRDHCGVRKWTLYAVNCRSNHVHVVVAGNCHPKSIREQLKAWCTRKLKELEECRRKDASVSKKLEQIRQNWWAERGSGYFINDEQGLQAVVFYVEHAQERKGDKESNLTHAPNEHRSASN